MRRSSGLLSAVAKSTLFEWKQQSFQNLPMSNPGLLSREAGCPRSAHPRTTAASVHLLRRREQRVLGAKRGSLQAVRERRAPELDAALHSVRGSPQKSDAIADDPRTAAARVAERAAARRAGLVRPAQSLRPPPDAARAAGRRRAPPPAGPGSIFGKIHSVRTGTGWGAAADRAAERAAARRAGLVPQTLAAWPPPARTAATLARKFSAITRTSLWPTPRCRACRRPPRRLRSPSNRSGRGEGCGRRR